MNKVIALTFFLCCIALYTFAKKDSNAWKKESKLEKQYEVFKENLNFWNGSYFLLPDQLNQYFGAMSDTIAAKEQQAAIAREKIGQQQQELKARQKTIEEIQELLGESRRLQNSVVVLGMKVNKHVYSSVMYLLILGALVLAGFVFMLYKKGLGSARQVRKEYEELKNEYEEHKKNVLERYTKINMELHKTRLELNKK